MDGGRRAGERVDAKARRFDLGGGEGGLMILLCRDDRMGLADECMSERLLAVERFEFRGASEAESRITSTQAGTGMSLSDSAESSSSRRKD